MLLYGATLNVALNEEGSMLTALNVLYDRLYGGIGLARLEKIGEKERIRKLITDAAIKRMQFLPLDSVDVLLITEVANELQPLVQRIAEVHKRTVLTLSISSVHERS